jgi:hypothetical protein
VIVPLEALNTADAFVPKDRLASQLVQVIEANVPPLMGKRLLLRRQPLNG